MTAINYLRQYEEAVRRVKHIERELEEERILIDSIRSVSDNDGMPHGSNISKPTEAKAIRLADKQLRLVEAKLEAIRVRQEIFDVVIAVGGLESDVLIERYINLKKWEKVCEAVCYTWPTVRSAWHRGLDKVDKIISTRTYMRTYVL